MMRNRLTGLLTLSALLGLAAAGSLLRPGMVLAAASTPAATSVPQAAPHADTHAEHQDPRSRFGAFARMADSEWTIDGAWDDGSPLKAREVVDWILDGQFMRSRVFVTKPDGTEYQRYETIYVADPDHHGVRYHGFAFNGAVTEGTARQTDQNTIIYPPQGGPSGGGAVKQQIVFLDNDTMQWTVWTQTPEEPTASSDGAKPSQAAAHGNDQHEDDGVRHHGEHEDHDATHVGSAHHREAKADDDDHGSWQRLIQANWRRVRK